MSKMLDLAGKTVNGFKVLSFAGTAKRASFWRCICPRCGREFVVRGSRLVSTKKPMKDCGCSYAYGARDLTGEVHGGLTVLHRDGLNRNGNSQYLCRCNICGKEKLFSATSIKKDPSSCGCQHFAGYDFNAMSEKARKKTLVNGANIYLHSSTKPRLSNEYRWVSRDYRQGTCIYAASFTVRGHRYYKYGFSTAEAAHAWAVEAHQHICALEGIPTNLPEKRRRKQK